MIQRIRHILLVSLALLAVTAGYAQDPHFTQFTRIPTWYNPATSGHAVEHIRLTLLYRNQWAGATSPFRTEGIFFDKQVSKVGFGANIVNNTAGESGFRQLYLNGQLSYRMKFGRHALASGVQVGFIQKSFDPSKMTFDDQYTVDQGYNPNNPTSETFSYTKLTRPDFGLGLLWTYGKTGKDHFYPFAGLSLQHLNQPKESFIEQDNITPRKYTLNAGLGIWMNESWYLTPTLQYSQQQFAKELLGSVMVRLPMEDRNQVEGGIIFRNNDALALYAGYQWNSFMAGMSYDINISGATGGSGAFELTLTYIPKAKAKKEETKKKQKTPPKVEKESKEKDKPAKPPVTETKSKTVSNPVPKATPEKNKGTATPEKKPVEAKAKPVTKPVTRPVTAKPAVTKAAPAANEAPKEIITGAPIRNISAQIPVNISYPEPVTTAPLQSSQLTPVVTEGDADLITPMIVRNHLLVIPSTLKQPEPKRVAAKSAAKLAPVTIVEVTESPKVEQPVTTDADGDGIEDAKDKCPYMKGGAATGGCPDTDGDGITDMEDMCPLEPGTRATNGCAVKTAEITLNNATKHVGNIEFKTGSTEVHGLYKLDIIEPALDSLLDDPNLVLVIAGHTDSEGDAPFNMNLSQARADVVKNIFIRKGLEENRITTVAYGENMPIRDNLSDDGRQRNRRVEIHLMKKK